MNQRVERISAVPFPFLGLVTTTTDRGAGESDILHTYKDAADGLE
ncbi:MAG: hypothetical protein ACI97A_003589 [Planctomycetota bacterium]|jgi:hypothetical protein